MVKDLPADQNQYERGARFNSTNCFLALLSILSTGWSRAKQSIFMMAFDSTLVILGKLSGSRTGPFRKSVRKLSVLFWWSAIRPLNQVFMNIIQRYDWNHSDRGWTGINAFFYNSIDTGLNDWDWVQIRIRDNGNGIPAVIKQQIFTPILLQIQADWKRRTGMGWNWLSAHHRSASGACKLQASQSGGTEFVIEIPLERDWGSYVESE